jgi:hypothetical protein
VRTLFNIIIIIAGIVALVFAFDYFSPVKISSLVTSPSIGGGTCLKVTNIDTDEMEPMLSKGESVVFDRCIDAKRENLPNDTVILVNMGYFKKDEIKIIRRKVDSASGDYYRVSTLANPKETEDVQPENIIAIYEKP